MDLKEQRFLKQSRDEEKMGCWMDNVAMEWAKKLDSSGVNGTAVLKAYMDTMRDAGAKPVRNWDKE